MKDPSRGEIKKLSVTVAASIMEGNNESAFQMLKPLLDSRASFAKLDLLGRCIGHAGIHCPDEFFEAFDRIISYQAMGGFVIVGRAMISFLEDDFERTMQKSREYIIKGNQWYVCDIIGERSLGQALIDYFERTLPYLRTFLADENRWVRRSTGVAIHFFAKRTRGDPQKAKVLLTLTEPHLEEKQIDAVKGIGWGLKTIGKYYSDVLVSFLKEQIRNKRKISKLMMKKAMTYLKPDQKREIERYAQNLQS
jgi:3-methyladenine DNA glycosylase AlkD